MSENFVRRNPNLERRIVACTSAADIQNLLAEADAIAVMQGSGPAPTPSGQEPVGTRLKKLVQTEDGRSVLIQADSYFGLDILEAGVRSGQIVK